MCGIVGVLSSDGFKDAMKRKNFFTQALIADSFRGDHSTGLLMVDDNGGQEVYKKAVAGYDFIQLNHTQDLISNMDKGWAAIGHNRYATKGAINHVNAHPFQFGNIAGVHNGSLNKWSNLNDAGKHFDVDSKAIFHAIDAHGVNNIISEIDGAFALAWHDASDNTTHLIRNEERPLTIGKVKGGDTILVASEGMMLQWIAARNGLEIEEAFMTEVGHEYIFYMEEVKNYQVVKHKLYQKPIFHAPVNTTWGNNTPTKKFKDVRVEEALAPTGLNVGDIISADISYHRPYSKNSKIGMVWGYSLDLPNVPYTEVILHNVPIEDFKDFFDLENNDTVRVEAPIRYAKTINHAGTSYLQITLDYVQLSIVTETISTDKANLVLGPAGDYITEEEFNTLAKCGCNSCGTALKAQDADSVSWDVGADNAIVPLCPSCVGV